MSSQLRREAETHRVEAVRIMHSLYVASMIAMIIYNIVIQVYTDALVLAAVTIVSLLIRPALLRHAARRLVHAAFVTIVGGVFLWVLATGGASNTGYLWLALFPGFALYMLGLRAGVIAIILQSLLAISLFTLVLNDVLPGDYSSALVFRVMGLYTLLSVLSVVYERARQQNDVSATRLSELLSKRASTDDLTGLLNRAAFREALIAPVSPTCVLMMDIDHFKRLNDTHGHAFGDQILVHLAQTLQRGLRRDDVVARWGGEEFVIALPGSDALSGHCIAEQLRMRIEMEPFPAVTEESDPTHITASFGVGVMYPQDRDAKINKLTDAIAEADTHLYEAKDAGRNRVVSESEVLGCID